MEREFNKDDGSAYLEVGNGLRLESVPRKFDLVHAQADIAQTEDAFDVRSSRLMLAAGCTPQIKQDTGNRTALQIANHSLQRRRGGGRTFWNAAIRFGLTRC